MARSAPPQFAGQKTVAKTHGNAATVSFRQRRIRTFHLVVLGLGLLFFAVVNFARWIHEGRVISEWFWGPCNWLNLLQVGLNLAFVFGLAEGGFGKRSGELRAGRLLQNPRFLQAIDIGGTLGVTTICAAYGWAEQFLPMQEYHALLAVSNTLVLRAFLVPASPRVALGIAAVAVLPGFLPVFFEADTGPEGALLKAAVFLSWSLISVVLSAFAARVVHGLRRQVKEAEQLGQYTLGEEIGAGGFGTVYRGEHAMLRRPTAIKILASPDLSEDDVVRFEREVQITSELTHPNTISIFDYGKTEEGIFYYAMEHLIGLNLQQLISIHGAQHPARVVPILTQVLGSLAEAHDRGLVHRDIKPANIFLCARGGTFDAVKVLDFGLVKPADDESDRASDEPEGLMGTPRYLSPEAIHDPARAEARSDLYALGAVAYFLLTGSHVFHAKSVKEILEKQMREEPESPSARLGREIPEALEALVLDALAKRPDDRPKSATEFAERLADVEMSMKWGAAEARLWWFQNEIELAEQMPGAQKRSTVTEMMRAVRQDAPTMVVGRRTGR